MTEVYDALEHCLEAMERGASIDNALRRYPELASELRPLLLASLVARGSSRVHVPVDVRKRGRERLLRYVRQAEATAKRPRLRIIPAFPRMAMTAVLAAALVLTSTGLVSASSASLPGQHLYPVKRTWESIRLWFVFGAAERDLLESDYEQERINEISELLGKRMEAPIAFSGLLSKQADGNWTISGIPVSVTSSTSLPTTAISDGAPLAVTGVTGADGLVRAQQIQVLQPGAALPPLEPAHDAEYQIGGSGEQSGHNATPVAPSPQPGNPTPQPTYAIYEFSGVVQSMQGNVWQINGQTVYMDGASVTGSIQIGTIVRFKGHYLSDGRFIVTSIQAHSGTSNDKHDSGGSGEGGEGEGGGEGGGESGGDGP